MFGLIVAIIYGAGVYFLGKPNTAPEVFLSATNLLFWWYIVTSAIWGIIVVLIALGILGGITILGASKGGILGMILGFLGGGALSVLILVLVAIGAGCLIGGAYLLHDSLTITPTGAPEWDTIKLVFGGILLVVGLRMGKSSSSSSSKG